MKKSSILAAAAAAVVLPASFAAAVTVDLDQVNSGTINGGTFTRASDQPFGSAHRVFLRYEDMGGDHGQVDDPNVKDQEEGYNSDYRPVQFEELTDNQHTLAVLLSSLDVSDGKIHFILDNNEPNAEGGNNKKTISLEMVQVYYAGEGGDQASNFDISTESFEIGDTGNPLSVQKIYDMDEGPDGDSIVLMTDINNGSGQADMTLDITAPAFGDFKYLILYAKQGFTQPTEAGFEEWGVLTGEPPVIPLPAAAWSALGLLGALGVAKKVRSRKEA
jgi:hypothetical protein